MIARRPAPHPPEHALEVRELVLVVLWRGAPLLLTTEDLRVLRGGGGYGRSAVLKSPRDQPC
jgi:hypothetical protein